MSRHDRHTLRKRRKTRQCYSRIRRRLSRPELWRLVCRTSLFRESLIFDVRSARRACALTVQASPRPRRACLPRLVAGIWRDLWPPPRSARSHRRQTWSRRPTLLHFVPVPWGQLWRLATRLWSWLDDTPGIKNGKVRRGVERAYRKVIRSARLRITNVVHFLDEVLA